jgi:hypothetical protein
VEHNWFVGSKLSKGPDTNFPEGVFPLYAKTHEKNETNNISTTLEDFASNILEEPDDGEEADYQVDHEACVRWVNRSLGRAITMEELDAKVATFETKSSEHALRDWHKKSAKAVEDEINLSLLENDVQLKFVSIPSIRASRKDDHERGYYEALVTVKNKESKDYEKTKLYKPSNDWVEANFTGECLTIIQEIAKETGKVYKPPGSSKTERGFVPLHKPLIYVVENEQKQISKMRYLPPKQSKNAMGEVIWLSETWKGLVQNHRQQVEESILLQKEWVEKNISKAMRKFMKNLR